MKIYPIITAAAIILSSLSVSVSAAENQAPVAASVPAPVASPLLAEADAFNRFNTRLRDGKIAKGAARAELPRLLDVLRDGYYRAGGKDYPEREWVFPVAGYSARSITGGRSKGYIASGYDYFSGNRHGGHPSFDIFIRDRNQDSLDDRTDQPVDVLSLTGGLVVALEDQWQQGSKLRGGKYIWVYDPANHLLVYYAHNGSLAVKLGDLVKPGDELAIMGRSGLNAAKRRSPTHLHLTVLRIKDGYPLPWNVYQQLTRARLTEVD